MNWHLLTPEIVLAGFVLVLLAVDLIHAPWKLRMLRVMALAGLVAASACLWTQRDIVGTAAQGAYIFDAFAVALKFLFLGITAVVVVFAHEFLTRQHVLRGELYPLSLLAGIGMLFLASAGDFLLLFVALELMTFSLYVMTAYVRSDTRSTEAGLKYLILGAIASGCLVFGASVTYGATGMIQFQLIQQHIAMHGMSPLLLVGSVLVLAGLGFKLSAVPFHLWVPDVYEGAPVPVTAFLAAGSKAAGFAVFIRLLHTLYGSLLAHHAVPLLAIAAAVTMCYGNLAAIPQRNMKRLLAFSSIGHAGFLLLGLAAMSRDGTSAVVFYLVAYAVMTLAAFAVVTCVSNAAGSDDMDAYEGLSTRSPLLAAALFLALLSLAGVPPLIGFFGKLWLLLAAVQQGLLWLVAIGVVNVVISLYYYLRVIQRMYVSPALADLAVPTGFLMQLTVYALVVLMVLLGVFQQPLVAFALQATQGF